MHLTDGKSLWWMYHCPMVENNTVHRLMFILWQSYLTINLCAELSVKLLWSVCINQGWYMTLRTIFSNAGSWHLEILSYMSKTFIYMGKYWWLQNAFVTEIVSLKYLKNSLILIYLFELNWAISLNWVDSFKPVPQNFHSQWH